MRSSLSKNLRLRKPPKTPNPDDTENMSQGSTVSANGVAVATIAPYTVPAVPSDVVSSATASASSVVSSATASASSVASSATDPSSTHTSSAKSTKQSDSSTTKTDSSKTASSAAASSSSSAASVSSAAASSSSAAASPHSSSRTSPAASPTSTPYVSAGLSQPAKIGVGLGVPLAALLLAALAFLLYRHHRHASASRRAHAKALEGGGGGFDTLDAADGFGAAARPGGTRGGGFGRVDGEKVEERGRHNRTSEIGGGEVPAYSRELPGDGGVRRVELA